MSTRRPLLCSGAPLLLAALVSAGAAGPLAAQVGYRATVDLDMQTVAFRGWTLDSVPAAQVSPGPTGGPLTSSGYAATCPSVSTFCFFYRPGDRQTTAPVGGSVALTVWGLGVPGLSLHGNARVLLNAGNVDWAGTDPTFQFWEGYAEYERSALDFRVGRQIFRSRLGSAGFDGVQGTLRARGPGLAATGYFGFGLAQSASVPITSDVVNPLGEFRPPERNWIMGAVGAWSTAASDLRVEWQREVDRASAKLASERLAGSGTLRPARNWALTGGAEYNLAEGVWGSADASLHYTDDVVGASFGYRRYRPFFDLWSIWAAFSPVAYNAVLGSASITPVAGVQLRGRAEYYKYEAADAPSPLVSVENDGSRWSAGIRVTRLRGWAFDLGYDLDKGVGARGDGWDASVRWTPTPRMALQAFGSTLDRPLELRFDDARVRWVGLDLDFRVRPDFSFGLGGLYVHEDRQRPDAAAFDWNQARITARVRYVIGSRGADRLGLPRAVERMPSVTGSGR